ncbi:glycosyltransferase family 2 protein [Aestuariibacter salexigens]|uniref:glycosyltransferase family 2 protein n=1 Tax=Aestuariibacter salexigens TaxID=226010 RepID=UPI000418D0AF|nr:glycosyltransferase [Aestuariibacter salexigens]
MIISLVIPVYNNIELTRSCLETLADTRGENADFVTVVVDDGSTDDIKVLSSMFSGLHYLRNDSNAGYLVTTNRGIEYSLTNIKADVVVLLNNDMQFYGKWLDKLIEGLRQYDITGYFSLEGENQEQIKEVEYLEFSCVAIRREVFDAIGVLDERFYNGYYSDNDYCLRAKLACFSLAVLPNSKSSGVTHECGQTFGVDKRKKIMMDMYNEFCTKWVSSTSSIVINYLNRVVYNPHSDRIGLGLLGNLKRVFNRFIKKDSSRH